MFVALLKNKTREVRDAATANMSCPTPLLEILAVGADTEIGDWAMRTVLSKP